MASFISDALGDDVTSLTRNDARETYQLPPSPQTGMSKSVLRLAQNR